MPNVKTHLKRVPFERCFNMCSYHCLIRLTEANVRTIQYSEMKNGAILATVTSADDELNLSSLIADSVLMLHPDAPKVGPNPEVSQYLIVSTGNTLYIIADGDIANASLRTGIGDPSMFLPEAAQLLATGLILNRCQTLKPGLQGLGVQTEKLLAECWLNCFY